MRSLAALILVCTLWGLEWLRELLVIPQTPAALRSAIVCTVAATFCSLYAPNRTLSSRGAAVGVGLFALPVLLQQISHLSGYTAAALWTLVPVMVVVVCGVRSSGLQQEQLLTALAGVAGALLIFPVSFPSSVNESLTWLVFLSAVVSVAVSSSFAMGTTGLSGFGLASAAGMLWLVCLANGTTTITAPELLWIACFDLPAMLLLLWLLQFMQPEALSTRYLLPVVVTILTSWIALHQQMSLRFALGVLLLAGSALLLLIQSRKATA